MAVGAGAIAGNTENPGIAFTSSDGGQTWTQSTLPITVGDLNGVACTGPSTCIAIGVREKNTSLGAIAIYTTYGGTTWNFGSGFGSAGQMYSLSCPTTTFCMASNYGTVFISNNGGVTWLQTTIPSEAGELNGVSCINSSTCVVVGSNSSFTGAYEIATSNGGVSWTQISSAPSTVTILNDISCTTYECVSVGTTNTSTSVILYSNNGGTTWTVESSPSFLTDPNAVFCVTNSTCMVSQGDKSSIAVSTDGGQLWGTSNLPSGLIDGIGLYCSNSTDCLVAELGSASIALVIGYTSTTGSSWSATTLPAMSESLASISCPTITTCFAAGFSFPSAAIEMTTNGGVTWTPQSVPSSEFSIDSISCFNTTDCVAVGGTQLNVAQPIYTTNGGSTWNLGTYPSNVELGSVSCTSATYCVGVGSMSNTGAGVAAITSNGGQSWLLGSVPSGIKYIQNISCGSSTNCVALTGNGSPAVLYSTDSGATWSQDATPLPSTVALLNDVSCGNATQCVFVARNSSTYATAYYSSDGGQTWTISTLPSGTFISIDSVSCIGGSLCVALGSGVSNYVPVSFESSDGGATWTQLQLPPNLQEVFGISCPGISTCYSSSNYGASTWGMLAFNATPVVTGVSPSSGSTGGGLSVTITGSGFTGATGISFGSVQATGFTVVNDSTIQVNSPTSPSPGAVNVTVTGPGGVSATSASDIITYEHYGATTLEAPVRICDTRSGATDPSTYADQSLGQGFTFNLPVVGANGDGVPSSASAVIVNVTAVHPSAWGYFTIWPSGGAVPATSALNFSQGENAVANLVEVGIGSNGDISIQNAYGNTDLLVDVAGWVGPVANNSGLFNPITPARIYDTRTNSGFPGANSTLTPGGTATVSVEGSGGVPASGVSGVVANITATNTTSAGGYLTVYPTGSTFPTVSNVNFDANQSVPNRVMVKLGTNGDISIYNALGSTDVIVDISGWFTDATTSSGYQFHPVTPTRIFDTRMPASSGLQGGDTPLAINQPFTVQVTQANSDSVPANATALVGNLTSTNTVSNGGFMTAYPSNVSMPKTSDVN